MERGGWRRAFEAVVTIERVWSAKATRDGAAAYAAYFRRVVLPELAAVAGYRGVRLLQREIEGTIEIVVTTEWESLDVIRGFAGEDIDQAVVHDEAAALLTDYERTVRHFDILVRRP
jgi:heme-degrading monooxygenase HmoA